MSVGRAYLGASCVLVRSIERGVALVELLDGNALPRGEELKVPVPWLRASPPVRLAGASAPELGDLVVECLGGDTAHGAPLAALYWYAGLAPDLERALLVEVGARTDAGRTHWVEWQHFRANFRRVGRMAAALGGANGV